jgi:hypothetical protein
MKNFFAVFFIGIFLFAGCADSISSFVFFDKPQPDNTKSLDSFSKILQGRYSDSDEVSILTIGNNIITRHFNYDCKLPQDSLDSSFKIVGDTIIDLTDGTKEKVLLKGDTIIVHFDVIDTIFNISKGDVLKKFKGYYFLNRPEGNDWSVQSLSLKKGILTISYISIDGIQKLGNITETASDTILLPINFNLTKKQFKTFVKQNGFDEQEIFMRIK